MTDGRVAHDAGGGMPGGDAVCVDVSGLGFASDTPTNPLHLSHLSRPRQTPHTVAVLTTGPNHNYYHWLIEALPRLDLYERSGIAIDRFYAPIRHRFQRETLSLLGISRDRIVPATCHAHLAPSRLVASSLHGGISQVKTDFLFRRLTAHVAPWAGPALRIFIARRGPRSIVNEREVLRALRPLGFERLRLEGMPLAEQIAVFSRAECVIGPHGAGLTNLAFCRPGTQVIEIGTPYRPWACFYEIAHHRELDYHLHMASPTRIRHFNPQTAVGDSDLRVDPVELRDVVDLLLSGRSGLSERAAA
jgi:capsular polysaccharide biosynthesis protein